MATTPCTNLAAQLRSLTNTELASLIIEFVESDEVAVALGEETLRRLTGLQVQEGLALPARPSALALS